ncbi:MAG: encapsulin [Vicinamibacterales bacterium]
MADSHGQLQWTDDYWNRIRRVVLEEARAARVAGGFLPLDGPLEPDASYVPQQTLVRPGDRVSIVPGFTVDDTTTLKLSTLETKVYLRPAQVADPKLTSALIAFRRAANVLAHLEDEIIFRGQKGENQGPKDLPGTTNSPSSAGTVQGGEESDGLLRCASTSTEVVRASGEELVSHVSRSIGLLERNCHLGPFACVLGAKYFQIAQTPNDSLMLPQDRILPFLGGGSIVRSSAIADTTGLVIALGGAPIDLVVATDVSVAFLQVTAEAWFVFRVYEKMVLRVNQSDAIACFSTV